MRGVCGIALICARASGIYFRSSCQSYLIRLPSGIPVEALPIDGSKNAALLAVQILATSDPALQQRFIDYNANMVGEEGIKNARAQEQLFP